MKIYTSAILAALAPLIQSSPLPSLSQLFKRQTSTFYPQVHITFYPNQGGTDCVVRNSNEHFIYDSVPCTGIDNYYGPQTPFYHYNNFNVSTTCILTMYTTLGDCKAKKKAVLTFDKKTPKNKCTTAASPLRAYKVTGCPKNFQDTMFGGTNQKILNRYDAEGVPVQHWL